MPSNLILSKPPPQSHEHFCFAGRGGIGFGIQHLFEQGHFPRDPEEHGEEFISLPQPFCKYPQQQ